MKLLLISLALFIGQGNTLEVKPVVHLQPHRNVIEVAFGGKRLELVKAPPVVQLPEYPPKLDDHARRWVVEVRNLGPGTVTVVGKAQFSVQINDRQTVLIYSNGTAYSLTP